MKIEYEVNVEFNKVVAAVLSNPRYAEFNEIRDQDVHVLAVVATRTNSATGEHEPAKVHVTCRKLTPVVKLLADGDYLVTIDYYFWTHSDETKVNAALFDALSCISVERSKKGDIKLKTRKPDYVGFCATLKHFGAWDEPQLNMREALKVSAKQFAENQKPKGA